MVYVRESTHWKTRLVVWLVVASLGLVSCSTSVLPAASVPASEQPDAAMAAGSPTAIPIVDELAVQLLPLSGQVSNPKAQYSGMAWFGDWLILLPQYPAYFQRDGTASLVAFGKSDILAILDGTSSAPLEPHFIALDDQELMRSIRGFEGFECLTFHQDSVYLSIEAKPAKMLGYLVKGSVQSDPAGVPVSIQLEPASLVEIQPQAALDNYADEACLVYNQQVYTIYEANGLHVNPMPETHVFSLDLQQQDTLIFPHIEYRITDATQPDAEGRFWAINYLYPGDLDKLNPVETNGLDALALQYGVGRMHAEYAVVERLIQFEIRETLIQRVDTPPLQLVLVSNLTARNWEGIVVLDGRGFLLVTDSFPDTQLGFVAYPP